MRDGVYRPGPAGDLLLLWLNEALKARKNIKHNTVHNINGFQITAHSQQSQEIDIIKNFMPKIDQVRDGTFVELGGFDGITFSNTKGIEDTFGFKGVLIEPSDAFVAMDINRPNTQNYRAAISKEPSVLFYGSTPVAGTQKNKMAEDRYQLADTYGFSRKEVYEKNSYKVPGLPISQILQDSKLKYIDLFFIDVEGSELDVIETMDWSIPVYLICIEMHHDDHKKEDRALIRKTLIDKGFTYNKKIADDEIWVNESYFRKNKFI